VACLVVDGALQGAILAERLVDVCEEDSAQGRVDQGVVDWCSARRHCREAAGCDRQKHNPAYPAFREVPRGDQGDVLLAGSGTSS
jgi:hypothetical protein